MGSTAKKREVLQLLRDYRSWHSPYGGAAPHDSTLNLESAGAYGPAGLIMEGMAFGEDLKDDALKLYGETYGLLEQALEKLKDEYFEHWIMLLTPYLGDPADPAIVDMWREKKPNLAERHDNAIAKLAEYLRFEELFVVFPKRIVVRRQGTNKQRNDEFYEAYRKLKQEGESNRKAIQTAAEWCDYSEPQAYDIVRVREGGAKRIRKKGA